MSWSLDPSSGELLVLTRVTGPAAKMGHRLTIAMRSWHADVSWRGNRPVSAELTVDVDSLDILRGQGGVTPLTGKEKPVARANALKSLESRKYPRIRFTADTVEATEAGYRLIGDLEIHGVSRPRAIDVAVEDTGATLAISVETTVAQSDFGIKLVSLMMGALKVADEVTVAFRATHRK